MPQVRAVVREAGQHGNRLSAIVTGIVNSDAFRMQALPHDGESDETRVVLRAANAGSEQVN
jgi:hypothetical protein